MRDTPVGNGTLCVNFDDKYQIRDIFFPHVGQENHTEGFPSRFGVWVNGAFSWTFDDVWTRVINYREDTLVTATTLVNPKLGVELIFNDTVASHDNIFLRRVSITNAADEDREFRIFHHHDLRIYENYVGDTAFYDPASASMIHYKKHRYFLISTQPPFDAFATGRKAFRDQEGTWRDAEDGILSGGTITEGSVDSTIGIHFRIRANATESFYYWIAAGTNYQEVSDLNDLVKDHGPARYLNYTENYWRAWVNKEETDLSELSPAIRDLYKRSLLIMHTQADHGGALIAGNDSDVTERATDHYAYLWTRDGALIANAFDRAGFDHITRKFFDLCGRIVHEDGYFLQKYNPDGTVASGWHSAWDAVKGERLVPIQEDETSLVLWALWEHYDKFRDIEFAQRSYRKLIVRCADFLAAFRDPVTSLPSPSWNLWEDRRGVHTFTCATVVAGLRAAANFAYLFAENERGDAYIKAADEIVVGMKKHLFSTEHGRFLRSLTEVNGDLVPDATVDASLFGTFYFDCFSPHDEMVVGTMAAIENTLTVDSGIARFENDGYMRVTAEIVGNPWFICTLWMAEYYIARARTAEDLRRPIEILEWVVSKAHPSGVLPEQLDASTGDHTSISPLTWSHSTFVATVLSYLQKAAEIGSARN